MSRVSSKSALSPSATSGSSAIDLGKDSGVNLGEKTQTSVSTGGIGVTREVANIGGMSVTGGVSVEVSPVRLDISGNVDYDDPTKSSVSIGAGAEVPGGLLGVSGGVTINTTTGAIEEVSIGGEVAAFGANVSVGSDGSVGLEFTFQIPFTPIELSLGFGSSKDKKPAPAPTPTPTPAPILTPTPTSNSASNPNGFPTFQSCGAAGNMLVLINTLDVEQVPKYGSYSGLSYKLTKIDIALQILLDMYKREENRLSTSIGDNFLWRSCPPYRILQYEIWQASGIYSDFRPADELGINWWMDHWKITNQRESGPGVTEEIKIFNTLSTGDWYWEEPRRPILFLASQVK